MRMTLEQKRTMGMRIARDNSPNTGRTDMLQRSFKMSQKTLRKVERMARRRGVSLSDVVEFAIGRLYAMEDCEKWRTVSRIPAWSSRPPDSP